MLKETETSFFKQLAIRTSTLLFEGLINNNDNNVTVHQVQAPENAVRSKIIQPDYV